MRNPASRMGGLQKKFTFDLVPTPSDNKCQVAKKEVPTRCMCVYHIFCHLYICLQLKAKIAAFAPLFTCWKTLFPIRWFQLGPDLQLPSTICLTQTTTTLPPEVKLESPPLTPPMPLTPPREGGDIVFTGMSLPPPTSQQCTELTQTITTLPLQVQYMYFVFVLHLIKIAFSFGKFV